MHFLFSNQIFGTRLDFIIHCKNNNTKIVFFIEIKMIKIQNFLPLLFRHFFVVLQGQYLRRNRSIHLHQKKQNFYLLYFSMMNIYLLGV